MIITDEHLRDDVINRLFWNDLVNVADISVRVRSGEVTLSGTVPDYAARQAAAQVARDAGAVEVHNQLTIRYPDISAPPPDLELAACVRDALACSGELDVSAIDVTVQSGLARMEGFVDTRRKKERAAAMASSVSGIVSVSNELAVVPSGDPHDKRIARNIMEGLCPNVLFNMREMTVEVDRAVVTLSGAVPSRAAYRAAYEIARYTIGVKGVHNDLEVVK
ncbi:MAG: BON domain-containing protein [Planctomycetaceae bacterium]|nr:BON domain-containing protein [Planctomycetaceae bacterium]